MRIGKMDRRLEFQSFTLGSAGDPTSGTWTTETTVWGERMSAAGAERAMGRTVEVAGATQAYRIRYRSDINPTWRVLDDGEYWRIAAVLPGDRGRERETLLLVARFDPDDDA